MPNCLECGDGMDRESMYLEDAVLKVRRRNCTCGYMRVRNAVPSLHIAGDKACKWRAFFRALMRLDYLFLQAEKKTADCWLVARVHKDSETSPLESAIKVVYVYEHRPIDQLMGVLRRECRILGPLAGGGTGEIVSPNTKFVVFFSPRENDYREIITVYSGEGAPHEWPGAEIQLSHFFPQQ